MSATNARISVTPRMTVRAPASVFEELRLLSRAARSVSPPDRDGGVLPAASANTHTVRRCARQSEIASGALAASPSSRPMAIAV